jgi:hypothetical protein
MRRIILLVVVSAFMLAMSAGTALAAQVRLLPGDVCLHERSPVISGIIIIGEDEEPEVFACNLSAPPNGEEVPL